MTIIKLTDKQAQYLRYVINVHQLNEDAGAKEWRAEYNLLNAIAKKLGMADL